MSIEIRVHKASAGARWFKAGLDIFQLQPFTFIFMYLFIGVFGLIGALAPMLNIPVALATPFLMAGLFNAALRRQQGHKVAFADVISVFSQKGRRMGVFRVGIYQLGAGLLLSMVANVLFADTIAIMTQPDINPETAMAELAQSFSLSSLVLFLVLCSIYLCAFAFAVPLVYFAGYRSIFTVLKASLMAFYHNMWAMTVFGLIGGGLILVSAILSFIPLLVVLPICYISLLVAFEAIFMPNLQSDNVTQQGDNAPQRASEQHTQSQDGRFDA
ncbi:BPSS1780 family membrane protein [Pseudoalteromonas sp. SSDWG2]|uniref:BPSS1780 family membrane protein n=1 Tax=Pseudoalteromonas sp. SSDWG2 TaxID=3139391 RepID=UPI003BABB03B